MGAGERMPGRDDAVGLAALLREGELSAEALVRACLDRIAEVEPQVRAWSFLDPDLALAQAREADDWRRRGGPLGPLHGLPVGVKDIIDTADMPTELGTMLHAGRRPARDAAVVRRLREAGAIILGKTVTTELATYAPGPTRNPHRLEHTPGGSSSGSAAAVAAGMVPLALGTQTNGSVIRPAAYCGVVGFKPSFGTVSRFGILRQSRALDQVGVFGRSVEDVALIADALQGYDERDSDTRLQAHMAMLATAQSAPPVAPRLAFVRTPVWDQAETQMQEAMAELAGALGAQVETFTLPARFAAAWDWLRDIMETDLARHLREEYERGADRLSDSLRGQIERGRQVRAVDYANALDSAAALTAALEELYLRYDAVLTPAAPGPAPRGLDSTGSPVFCTLWTLCGLPALSLPLLRSADGLPMGVQLVGFRGEDARLLRTARWLTETLAAS